MNVRLLPARVFYKLYRLSLPRSHPARDNVWFRPGAQDVYLVSYPRSGNTWMRVILAELLYGKSGKGIKDLQYYVPDVHVATRCIDVIQADFHVVKSHLPLHMDMADTENYQCVVYLVRDPRDVVLSYHRYLAALGRYRSGFEQFVADWAAGRIWPCSWQEHVHSWTGRGIEQIGRRICVVRYEDLVADTAGQVARVGSFLGIPIAEESLHRALAAASVEQMKRKERKGMPDHEAVDGLQFVGDAVAHQREGRLTAEQLDWITESAGTAMKAHGYL